MNTSLLDYILFDDGDISVVARPDSAGLVISVRRDPDRVDIRYAKGMLPGLYNRPSPMKSDVMRAVSGLSGPFSTAFQDFQRNVTEEMLQNVIDTAMAVSSGAPATDVYQEICRWTPDKDLGEPGQPWKLLTDEDIFGKEETCPDCGGTGEIQLFVSTVPCERCRV